MRPNPHYKSPGQPIGRISPGVRSALCQFYLPNPAPDASYNARMPVPALRRLLFGAATCGLVLSGATNAGRVQTLDTFAAHIAQLSERAGYFDTDNLISNERSYLRVVPALRGADIAGGAYIGVGPDQNFSYIAQLKPSIAFIVDLRRDNLLLHLLFKALFSVSDTRADYLCQLVGRPVPARLDDWKTTPVDGLIAYVDGGHPTDAATTALRARIDAAIRTFGVPLSAEDMATIDRFHRRFISDGLDLQFETTGRAPQPYYPTYRDLLRETDRQGHAWNFLASEEAFQTVRALERRDLVVPVVGDLSGPSALVAIGRLMAARGDRLSAFYASNVEFYLYNAGRFPRFLDNLSQLPHTKQSVVIRAIFGRGARTDPGYASASLVQPVDELVDGYANGRFRTYLELAALR